MLNFMLNRTGVVFRADTVCASPTHQKGRMSDSNQSSGSGKSEDKITLVFLKRYIHIFTYNTFEHYVTPHHPYLSRVKYNTVIYQDTRLITIYHRSVCSVPYILNTIKTSVLGNQLYFAVSKDCVP